MTEEKNLVASKYVTAIGMIVIAVIAFVAGLFASPIVLQAGAGDPVWDKITKAENIIVGTEPS